MRLLETRIPPPLVMLLCAAVGYGLARAWPWPALPVPGWVAVAVMLAGVGLNLLPKLAFRRARTAMLLLGAMLWLGSAAGLLVVPLFVGWITRFQIVPEERALSARFGADHAAFRREVRRWL